MKKRVVAVALAAMMVLGSSMTVMASAPTQDSDNDYNASGDVTIQGDGTIQNAPADTVKVTLPSNIDLIADPSGVYGAAVAAGGTLTDFDKENLGQYAGKIVIKDKLVVNNKSSVPVKVKAVLKDTSVGTTSKSDIAEVDGGVADFFTWMAAVPSKTDIVGDVSKYVANDQGVELTTAGSEVNMCLPNAKYLISGDTTSGFTHTIAAGDNGHGQALDIVGFLNKNADWTATGFTQTAGNKIAVEVVFTIAKAEPEDVMEASLPYGFMAGATMVPLGEAPSFATTGIYRQANRQASFDLNLGLGNVATTVAALYYDEGGKASANNSATPDMYTVSNGKLRLTLPDTWSEWTGDIKVYIKLANGDEGSVMCSYAADRDPSIGSTGTYTQATRQAVFDLDLGVGPTETTVASLYYDEGGKSSANNAATPDMYTVSNGKLTLTLPDTWSGWTGDIKIYIKLANNDDATILCTATP